VNKVNSNQNSAHQVQASDSMPDDASQNRRGFGANRRHARSVTGDGTFSYQSKTMEPVEWTISGLGGSLDSSKEQGVVRRADWKTNNNHKEISSHQQDGPVSSKFFGFTPISKSSRGSSQVNRSTRDESSLTGSMDTSTSRTSGSLTPAAEKLSTSKKLISDLVWLERKIAQNQAAEYAETLSPTSTDLTGPRPANDASDSLSFASGGDGTNGLTNSASQDSSLATGPVPPTYNPLHCLSRLLCSSWQAPHCDPFDQIWAGCPHRETQ